MWLIIADAHDAEANWLYVGLKQKGIANLHYLLPEELLGEYESGLQNSIGISDTNSNSEPGLNLGGDKIHGVINRMVNIPAKFLDRFHDADRTAIQQEWHAGFRRWLFSLSCPVFSPPSAELPQNAQLDPIEWARQARRAGFQVRPHDKNPAAAAVSEDPAEKAFMLIVFNQRVIAPRKIQEPIQTNCLNLARQVGTNLLGIELASSENGELEFVTASFVPALHRCGDILLESMAADLAALVA